jgi:hypothetical protein
MLKGLVAFSSMRLLLSFLVRRLEKHRFGQETRLAMAGVIKAVMAFHNCDSADSRVRCRTVTASPCSRRNESSPIRGHPPQFCLKDAMIPHAYLHHAGTDSCRYICGHDMK